MEFRIRACILELVQSFFIWLIGLIGLYKRIKGAILEFQKRFFFLAIQRSLTGLSRMLALRFYEKTTPLN